MCVCVRVFFWEGGGGQGGSMVRKHVIERAACVPSKARASQVAIEAMRAYFEALDKRSAVVVDPTASVLNVVDAEAESGCPTPAPAIKVSS